MYQIHRATSLIFGRSDDECCFSAGDVLDLLQRADTTVFHLWSPPDINARKVSRAWELYGRLIRSSKLMVHIGDFRLILSSLPRCGP